MSHYQLTLLKLNLPSADAFVDQNNESEDFVDKFREFGNIVDEKTLQYSENWISEDDPGYQLMTD